MIIKWMKKLKRVHEYLDLFNSKTSLIESATDIYSNVI